MPGGIQGIPPNGMASQGGIPSGPRPPAFGTPQYTSNVQNTYFGAASSGLLLPFSIGSVIGARSWDVTSEGFLMGLFWHQIWHPGRNAAVCLKRTTMGSYVPHPSAVSSPAPGSDLVVREAPPHSFEDCRCGFYGYFDGSNDYYRAGYVAGVIEAFGEVYIGTKGFRAMKAEIIALQIPSNYDEDKAAMIRANYSGVPIFDSFDNMIRTFPPTDPTDEATAPDQKAG